MKNNKQYLNFLTHNILKILVLGLLCVLSNTAECRGDTRQETLAYKLAILHVRTEHSANFKQGKPLRPASATVSEFQWILDELQVRCINPEIALADTMVEIQQKLTQRGLQIPLLKVARELAKTAKNKKLFGTEKVNFRMTSTYWLLKTYPKYFTEEDLE